MKEILANIVLCDIEGTTTSIDFVKEVLFPYSKDNARAFLTDNWGTDATKEVVQTFRKQCQEDKDKGIDGLIDIPSGADDDPALIDPLLQNIEWQIQSDRKTFALKNLQGMIWEDGYRNECLQGHIYDDVPGFLEKCCDHGIKVYIYSSGSVQAQKLLFENSIKGDLLQFIKGHFDTQIGQKQCTESYKAILKQLDCFGDNVVFFTDIAKEGYAAKEAGMKVIILSRPGNAPLTKEDKECFEVISDFNEISISRKK